MKKISITTLGCKTNQFESEAVLNQFIKNGYVLSELNDDPDVVIINTCCVTNRAEYKSRYAIRRALKSISPGGKVVVAGCYVNKGSSFFNKNSERLVLFPNNKKHEIFHHIEKSTEESPQNFLELSTDSYYLHTRVPVKVQDGCSFFCAYCILPYVRGKPVSRPIRSVIEQVNTLAAKGVKEIILTGINLGLYGFDLENYNLLYLLKEIVRTDIQQIRLSSIEPMFFDDDLILFLASQEKICPHFHIPLQSGSDIVLAKMNRTYSTTDFMKIIENIKTAMPDTAIGCDVIVGFPGETDEEFCKTYDFIEDLPISYLHVFRYSPRKFTKASEMKWDLNGTVSKKRMQSLLKLGHTKKNEYSKYLIEKKVPLKAVLETKEKEYWTSVSDHYVRIFLKDDNNTAENGMLKTVVSRELKTDNEGLIVEEFSHD